MKGYNWLGHHGPDPVNGACPNTAGKYSMAQSWGPNGHNHCFRVYESIADMIGGHMFDFLRNGNYDELLRNASSTNWNLDAAGMSYVCMYVQGLSTSACNTSTASTYWSGVKTYMEVADIVADEKGWPTSEEVAKNNNLAAGGKHTEMGNITGDVPNHSLHFDCSAAGGGTATTGSKITVIGDDIITQTKDKDGGLASKLTTAEFYANEYRALKDDTSQADDSVLDKVKALKESNSLRDVVIIAAGTDMGVQSYLKSDLTAIVDEIGSDKQIVFTTIYNGNGPEAFDGVNSYMKDLATANANIKVADWAAEASTSLVNEDMHTPSDGDGIQKFTDLIVGAIGTSMYNNASSDEDCGCDNGALSGGLSEEQAEKLITYYKDPTTDSKYNITIRTDNCVNMSGFFVQLFTKATWASDNGNGVVHELLAANPDMKGGTEPQPFSIFSVTSGSTICEDGNPCGHTGVVVAVNNDDIMTIEASYMDPSFTGVKHHTKDYFTNTKYPNEVFAYLSPSMDWSALTSIVGGSVNTTSSNSTLVNATWNDGWLSSGIEGVSKLSATESSKTIGDASYASDYSTNKSDGSVGPNKVTIIATDRLASSNIVDELYDYDGSIYPPHFTVDMKKKKIYQHLPITKPAASLTGEDNLAGGVQVALYGFSDIHNGSYDANWDLQSDNFGDTEWAYLALLLQAISDETGVEKTTSQDWANPTHLSSEDFKNATGFLGAMHSSGEWTDPGNVWEKINTQLAKMATSVDCDGGKIGEFVWYNQCDSKWKDVAYGSCDTICTSGCGCTSFAMMATILTGKTYTTDDV